MAKSGDVFVGLLEGGYPSDTGLTFDEMPLVEVFLGSERDGPYVHPRMNGKTPRKIARDRKLKDFLEMARGDKIVCPSCGELNCDLHLVGGGLWVERAERKEEFLFAFQAPGIVGSDGTAQFRRWAPLVIGREVDGISWPEEVISLILDDRDITGATCGVRVQKGSRIKVVLRRE